jgi:putative drug exporter of the RND superfamily
MRRHPWIIILIWFAAGMALSGFAAANSAKVTETDQAAFLPKSTESAQAVAFGREAFGQVKGATTVTVLVKPRDGGKLDAADLHSTAAVAQQLRGWHEAHGRVVATEAGGAAPNGRFALVGVKFKGSTTDPLAQRAFQHFRTDATHAFARHGLRAGYTGGMASIVDIAESSRSAVGLEMLILLGSIVLLNVVFFRGVLAAIVPLLTVLIVSSAAGGFVVGLAWLMGVKLEASTPQLISTVLMGVGIDYLLFLVFRFREELRAGHDRREAADRAARKVSHVIASAALAVTVAFGTLGIAEFGQFRVLGPAIAISVLVMLLAGVTLMPAVLAVTGRKLFWPSKSWQKERTNGFATRLGRFVAARPARVAVVAVVVLSVLALGAIGSKPTYDLDLKDRDMKSVQVSNEIAKTLPRGATDPQTVYVKSDHVLRPSELQPMLAEIAKVDGVEQVGKPQLTPDRHAAAVGLVLDTASTTDRAMDIARGPLRDAAHSAAPQGTDVMVGGSAAVMADVSDSISHDLKLIFPIAALLIAGILVVTLRSVLAPLYLLAAVGLEFAATMGASTLLFQGALGEPGLAFTLPLILFLFVVALGTDYNMLVAARLREEMDSGRPVREAVAGAVRHTAPAIGAAGVVLSIAFGSLMLYPDVATREMGFASMLGILLASLVVSTLLVPALTALVGRRAFRRRATPVDAHAERPLAA